MHHTYKTEDKYMEMLAVLRESMQPLLLFGFREIKSGEIEVRSPALRGNISFYFTLPDSWTEVCIGHIGEPGSGLEAYDIAIIQHSTDPVCVRSMAGRADLINTMKEALERENLCDPSSMHLPQIYTYLESKGFALQPVKSKAAFVFENKIGDEVKIHHETNHQAGLPMSAIVEHNGRYGDLPPRNKLMIEEFEKGNPVPVFSADIEAYMALRVGRDKASVCSAGMDGWQKPDVCRPS